jgi:hypothetical protein
MRSKAERLVGLECDVDTRLAELWATLWGEDGDVLAPVLGHEIARQTFGSAIRTAYAMGYRDALEEDARGERGELHRRHGYAHP